MPIDNVRRRRGNPAAGPPTLLARLGAVVRQRCPRCCRGQMFKGSFAMNDPCPVCGLLFQREEGYFLGAMYVSYLLSSVLLGGFFVLACLLLPGWNPMLLVLAAALPYLPLTPAVFRYSRVIWTHFERWVCPGDLSATAYERMRQGKTNSTAHLDLDFLIFVSSPPERRCSEGSQG
jgi:uncharacterized protein (DUF983 family)